ncbi:sugar transferase [Weissella confusa]|uniref:sugar transferase n=1 Tax=Weissella confusa TaxID=1583 RepID=UPI001A7EE8AD|nr:sugar transferase [Weissella confusa]
MKVSIYQRCIKRILDILFSMIILLLTIVPMVIIAVIIKLTSKGPVLFQQIRYGKNSIPFKIFKFRTMRQNSPIVANQGFSDIESYVTTVGKLLRVLSLDELPQLFNVLIGQMSFIGPRPLADTDLEVIERRKITGADVVRPGITGLAQVNGRNRVSNDDKAKYDKNYVDSISFFNDLKILWLTIVSVIKKTGINADQS